MRQQADVLGVANSNAPVAQEHEGLSIHLLVPAHFVLPTDTALGAQIRSTRSVEITHHQARG
jgi:hypothetical protein